MRVLNVRDVKRLGPDQIYIGRGTPWGNPFVIGTHGDRAGVIALYRRLLDEDPARRSKLEELRGKDLVCHCSPLPCHGDVILEVLGEDRELERFLGE